MKTSLTFDIISSYLAITQNLVFFSFSFSFLVRRRVWTHTLVVYRLYVNKRKKERGSNMFVTIECKGKSANVKAVRLRARVLMAPFFPFYLAAFFACCPCLFFLVFVWFSFSQREALGQGLRPLLNNGTRADQYFRGISITQSNPLLLWRQSPYHACPLRRHHINLARYRR